MMSQTNEVTHTSITLFSEQEKVHRLKFTLNILITILSLSLISELFFNGFSTLALAMSSSIVILLFFSLWASPDTCSVISGMVLWTVAVFVTYACWVGNGIFDTNVLAFPCLLMLAIVLSGRLIFISLFVYLISALCFFAFSQGQGLLASALLFDSLSLWGRVFSYIIMLTFFSVGFFHIFENIRKRFNDILEKNASLELAINQVKKRSRYDELTLLPNENSCKADLEKTLQQQKSSGHILAFITLNIRNQDLIKMNYSHSICDKTVKLLSKNLAAFANESTMIYRFQQNEFVILKSSNDHRGIRKFAKNIHQV